MMVRYPERNAEAQERCVAAIEQMRAQFEEDGFHVLTADCWMNQHDAEIEMTGTLDAADE